MQKHPSSSFSQRFFSGFTALTLGFSQLSLGVAGKTVHQQLEDGITYVKGTFDYKKDRKSSYTAPYKPQNPPKQSVGIYNGMPQEMPYEKLLMRVAPGKDGRERITETTQWPYLFHSQLTMHFPSGEYGGSGILVGPQHLLTAGHNVYNPDTKEWATHIIARLGLSDKVAPFGDLKAVKIYTFEEWINKGDRNFDMALLTLNKPIGLQTGWCGLLCLEDAGLLSEDVHVTGYPGDKGFNQMWSMSHTIKKVEPERIFYEIDTFGGQSGSGIWINKWDTPYTIGIHTLGEGGKYEGNSGVRLSQGKFTQVITEWISATRDIQEPILKQIAAAPQQLSPEPKEQPKPQPAAAQRQKAADEEIYQRFLKGRLVYRPKEGSDVGKIEMPIAALANPLEGIFDLSKCGDAGKYLSIATGYRKGKVAANANKVEIWLAPRFLIEKNLQATARHFSPIMSAWDAKKAPIGAFYTWGGWDELKWFNYVTTQDMKKFSTENFYEKWLAYPQIHSIFSEYGNRLHLRHAKNFMLILN